MKSRLHESHGDAHENGRSSHSFISHRGSSSWPLRRRFGALLHNRRRLRILFWQRHEYGFHAAVAFCSDWPRRERWRRSKKSEGKCWFARKYLLYFGSFSAVRVYLLFIILEHQTGCSRVLTSLFAVMFVLIDFLRCPMHAKWRYIVDLPHKK